MAEEVHESRVFQPEIHVGQIQKRGALFEVTHQLERIVVSRVHRGMTETQPPLTNGVIENRIALPLVERRHVTLLEKLRRHTGCFQCQEVRHHPHEMARRAGGKVHFALDLNQASQPSGRSPPQHATLQETAAQVLKMLPHQVLLSAGIPRAKAALHVAQRHSSARVRHRMQHPTQAAAQRRQNRKGQQVQQPKQGHHRACAPSADQTTLHAPGVSSCVGTDRGCL